MSSKGKLILLIEDNEQIMNGNQRLLERQGYKTAAASTLAEARALIGSHRPDAIILDIMLPDGSGLDFMRELRINDNYAIPILLLTGLTTKEDIVRGLTVGGDDYLTKPYDFSELLARVEALLRRAAQVPETIIKGRLVMDITAGVATCDGMDLLLTQKEFALLLIFIRNEGRCMDSAYLYEKIWKAPMAGDSQALKKTIMRLRLKIKDSGWWIDWSRGDGYSFGSD